MEEEKADSSYSWQIGFIYVFNLIVGSGLLTLPKVFAETGWLLGSIFLCLLALISYMTVTFVIEALSIANALQRHKDTQINEDINLETRAMDYGGIDNKGVNFHGDSGNKNKTVVPQAALQTFGNESRADPTPNYIYEITRTYEMGEMSKVFLNKSGVMLYYISICLFIYGGLAVYSAAISKSLTSVVCGDAQCFRKNLTDPCQNITQISVINVYYIMLALFAVCIGPFSYFNISSTKFLQVFTTTYRWFSMFAMIVLALIKIAKHEGVRDSPKLFDFNSLPSFVGVAIYSFMCQQSIPTVLTPVRNKKRIGLLVVLDFIFIILFFGSILITATFAFHPDELQDLYTLNFTSPVALKYMLQLFPVLTLSANFPIYVIVLAADLKKLILTKDQSEYSVFWTRFFFPTIVIIPTIAIPYFTSNVEILVGITGTYAGSIVQYVIPCLLVYCGRRRMVRLYGVYKNQYQSPFQHQIWIILVMLWYVACLVFVTYNYIKGN